MPALINCHTHLYSTLARGISLPGRAPKNFPEILKKLWWRLDRALNEEDVYYSALVGLIDAAKCGVGTLVDHHSSPNACAGSLDRIEQAFREVGLRGVLCYETSDRNGPLQALEGIRENIRFIDRAQRAPRGDGLVAATFGLHASFTLTDRDASPRRGSEPIAARGLPHPRGGGRLRRRSGEASAGSGRAGRAVPGGSLRARHRGRHRDSRAAPGQRGSQPAIQLQ